MDRDHWQPADLQTLFLWSNQNPRYGFALSNPKFEYWLLLHFEDGSGITSSRQCQERLETYLPNYEKGNLENRKLETGIRNAISRAKAKDSPPCVNWPTNRGTTVYRLVEKLIF